MKLTITQSEKYPTQYTVADGTPLLPIEEQVYFSGYFGTHGPGVYAAGPVTLSALERLFAAISNQNEGLYDALLAAVDAIAIAKGEVK